MSQSIHIQAVDPGPWREVALDKGLRWQANFLADLPMLGFDPNWLVQVLRNVVTNTSKCTPPGEEVGLSVGMEERVYLRYAD